MAGTTLETGLTLATATVPTTAGAADATSDIEALASKLNGELIAGIGVLISAGALTAAPTTGLTNDIEVSAATGTDARPTTESTAESTAGIGIDCPRKSLAGAGVRVSSGAPNNSTAETAAVIASNTPLIFLEVAPSDTAAFCWSSETLLEAGVKSASSQRSSTSCIGLKRRD